jgi:ATP-dependent Clp protease ATP-binding subunit ClpC
MQPQLTECARGTLENAQIQARDLNQDFVGTEHLFLALLDGNGCLGRTLRAQHVDREKVRSKVIAQLVKPEVPPVVTGKLPLSPKVQRTLNSAIVRAMSLRESKVSTRILMLSLLEEPNSAPETALRAAGADIDLLRQALAEKPVEVES